jgi:hypothetical protein
VTKPLAGSVNMNARNRMEFSHNSVKLFHSMIYFLPLNSLQGDKNIASAPLSGWLCDKKRRVCLIFCIQSGGLPDSGTQLE